MSVSRSVKTLLTLTGKRQADLADAFGMSAQTMSNKLARDSWFAKDLVKAAALCNAELVFLLEDGQTIKIPVNDEEK